MSKTEIFYKHADATNPEDPSGNYMILCHICNDKGGWGAGFVNAISRKWPQPERAYRDLSSYKLGEVQLVSTNDHVIVANMIAQHGYRFKSNPIPLDYDALRTCLSKVAKYAASRNYSIHMPRIGAGLAGGNWTKIASIIEETLCNAGLKVTVYDL